MSSNDFGQFSDDIFNELNNIPSGEEEVDLDEVMDSSFFAKYSKGQTFKNFSDWIKLGGLEPEGASGIEAIPDEAMNEWIRRSTTLNDWRDMLDAGFRKHHSLDW
ncbi:hypothetical protein JY98_03630 [Exiguobacterium mexicanum]|nr:hypothetical protein JY98_03630 [Exiguobacterium mexicanum]